MGIPNPIRYKCKYKHPRGYLISGGRHQLNSIEMRGFEINEVRPAVLQGESHPHWPNRPRKVGRAPLPFGQQWLLAGPCATGAGSMTLPSKALGGRLMHHLVISPPLGKIVLYISQAPPNSAGHTGFLVLRTLRVGHAGLRLRAFRWTRDP